MKAFNDFMNETIPLGEAGLYVGGAIAGEVTGMLAVGSAVLDSLNNASVYAPLHAKITELQSQNQTIQAANEQLSFRGDAGRAAKAYLGRQSTANVVEVKSLQAQEPRQIGTGAEVGILVGLGVVGSVAGVAIVRATTKSLSAIRSRSRKSEEASTP